jgi:hypothetical protein
VTVGYKRVRTMVATACLSGVLIAFLAGCGSSAHRTTTATSVTPATGAAPSSTAPAATSPPQTSVPLTATVPNCGGGAYKPATLLIVCGSATTMATGVTWSSWTASGAEGSGTVRLVEGGTSATAPGHLALSEVVNGSVGPQFTLLTVTWIGTSPDGKATDTFRLAAAP